MIYRINTPVVIATVKGVEQEFFTDEEYEKWAKTAPKHEASRYKGLGKFKTDRFKKLLQDREKYLVKISTLEATDSESLNLAFSGSRADDRKEWLTNINYFHTFE